MANRKRIWTPSTGVIPNNLANWKTVMTDVHDAILLAGLVQLPDAGQLDIDAQTVLPARNNFAGYRLYRFDDALQSEFPIIMKVEFGLGWNTPIYDQGWEASTTPRLACTVGVGVDSQGNFVGARSFRHLYPTEYEYDHVGSNTNTSNTPGKSVFCANEDAGFFGMVLGSGARNQFTAGGQYNSYPLSTFSIMIQRAVDQNGGPTSGGFCVLGPRVISGSHRGPGATSIALASFISNAGAVQSNRWAPRVDGNLSASAGAEVGMQPVYMRTPHIRRNPNLLTYFRTDLVEFTQHQIELSPGITRNFIALGGSTGMHSDEISVWDGAFAMLFEGTDV